MTPHDLAAPYALDALDAAERATFEAHLATCAQCRDAVAALQEGAAHLAGAAAAEPPAGMRDRVLAEVAATPQDRDVTSLAARRARLPARLLTAMAALVLLLAGTALFVTLVTDEVTSADVLAAADLVTVDLTPTDDYAGGPLQATVAFSPGEAAAVVTFAGLAGVDESQTYELWVIEGDTPRPAGLFRPGGDGRAQRLVEGEVSPGDLLAVTVERAGGADLPTGPVLFLASV